jgi:hypothetical protein
MLRNAAGRLCPTYPAHQERLSSGAVAQHLHQGKPRSSAYRPTLSIQCRGKTCEETMCHAAITGRLNPGSNGISRCCVWRSSRPGPHCPSEAVNTELAATLFIRPCQLVPRGALSHQCQIVPSSIIVKATSGSAVAVSFKRYRELQEAKQSCSYRAERTHGSCALGRTFRLALFDTGAL